MDIVWVLLGLFPIDVSGTPLPAVVYEVFDEQGQLVARCETREGMQVQAGGEWRLSQSTEPSVLPDIVHDEQARQWSFVLGQFSTIRGAGIEARLVDTPDGGPLGVKINGWCSSGREEVGR